MQHHVNVCFLLVGAGKLSPQLFLVRRSVFDAEDFLTPNLSLNIDDCDKRYLTPQQIETTKDFVMRLTSFTIAMKTSNHNVRTPGPLQPKSEKLRRTTIGDQITLSSLENDYPQMAFTFRTNLRINCKHCLRRLLKDCMCPPTRTFAKICIQFNSHRSITSYTQS